MGVPLDEVDLLTTGVDTSQPMSGTYALNMLHKNGSWQVRKGFGQRAQFDTSMSTNPKVPAAGLSAEEPWGYTRHVGSYLYKTSTDHLQLITVMEARNSATNMRQWNDSYVTGSNAMPTLYCVSIYDFETNERWEEPIYRSTSEADRLVSPAPERLGQYMTCINEGSDEWVVNNGSQVWFAEWADGLLFGSDSIGVMLYSPSTFMGNTHKGLDMISESNWRVGVSESACVTRCSPARGLFWNDGAGYAYLGPSDLPAPTAAVTYGDRVVYASGRNLYFSDQFFPMCIMAINIVDVPSDSEITALAVTGDTLLVMTSTQTWYFRAPPGDVVSQGRGATLLSEHVGCVGPEAVCGVGGAVAWCDRSGVYMTNGSSIEALSKPISKFFKSFITDPASLWFPLQGATLADSPTGTPARRSITQQMDSYLATMCYSEDEDALLLSVPGSNLALCYSDSQWAVWTFESNTRVNATPYPDGALDYVQNPQLVSRDGSLVLVGANDEQAFSPDLAKYVRDGGAVDVNDPFTSRSYYILEYGRGGGIDRSVADEDDRTLTGKYVVRRSDYGIMVDAPNQTDTPHDFYGGWAIVDPWIKAAKGYAFPTGSQATDHTYILPISVVPPKFFGPMPVNGTVDGKVHEVVIRFAFDNNKWEPAWKDRASAKIDFLLPSERMASVNGYLSGAGGVDHHVQVEDFAGSPDNTGAVISIAWNGVASGTDWYHSPEMNLNGLRRNPIIYIPMILKATPGANDVLSGMGLEDQRLYAPEPTCFLAERATTAPYARQHIAPLSMALWEQCAVGPMRKEDNVAQAVDWAYKTAEIGADSADRLIARGIAATMLSHGEGTESVAPSFPIGLFNTATAADGKMMTAQEIDFAAESDWTDYAPTKKPFSIQTNIYPHANPWSAIPTTIDTLRKRMMGNHSEIAPSKLMFGIQPTHLPPGSGVAYWGEQGSLDVDKGTVLVADEQVDTIVTSNGVRGTSFSVMMFGFIKNRAETIKLQTVKGLYRVRGKSRRRRGRS